jgi:hypothetical protein
MLLHNTFNISDYTILQKGDWCWLMNWQISGRNRSKSNRGKGKDRRLAWEYMHRGEVEVWLYLFLTLALERVAYSTPCASPFTPREEVDCFWNAMVHGQKPDFVYRRNGRVNLNRLWRQFSRLLATKLCASAVVILGKPCSEVVWSVLATHSILQFQIHFSFRASPYAKIF